VSETSDTPNDLPITFHLGDASWHDGEGWYYTFDDYPDEGSCGAFATREEAEGHAEASCDDADEVDDTVVGEPGTP
jgi:hypothetical protein